MRWNIKGGDVTAKTRKFSISVIFSILTGAFLISVTNSNVAAPTFVLEKNGRDFDKISIHPNSEDWLFTECSRDLNPHGDCHLLRYNINTKQLQRYLLPDGYLYGYASFSPRGNFIVMNRSPKHDGSEAGIRQSRENGEIAMMRSDGADFRVLPIPKGRNIAPVMSKDETRIAYWRNSDVPQPSGRTAGFGDFDIREYDLRTHKDSLFAGPFHFYEGGNSQYLSDDEIMINSYGPRQHGQSMSD
ncbi:MAG TPA: hypothetical protein VHK70_02265, partial [Burkholderiaceae bacterium]|nr:hypothetical protein [Burkholderiaceae bacterium]